MIIRNMQVNHLVQPMGYQLDQVTFSYIVDEAIGKKQLAAQIKVYETDSQTDPKLIYDSGMSGQINSLGMTVEMKELKPRTRYKWTVLVQSDAGEEAVGASWFETGKLDEAWTAQWITCEKEDRHPIFEKSFALDEKKDVQSARLYITGLGLYHAELNGKAVTDEKLTPYYTNYDQWVQYQTYDVTDLLTKVGNEIAVTMGNGWYGGRFAFAAKEGPDGYYGAGYKLLAELHIRYADGHEIIVSTDDQWQVTRSNYTFSNIYDGEHRDDTLPVVAPVAATVLGDAKIFPVIERLSLPVVVHETLPAIELIDTPAGEKVFDFGQNMAGGFRLRVCEPAGTEIRIQAGEVLQQGNFYRDNLRTALAEYVYISDGEEKVIEPIFTYYGFRYMKVEGLSDPKKEDMTALAYYSDIQPVGTLETGDPLLNQLLSNISWGQKSNFIDVPTDCPQRDERMGWTADTQVFTPTACFLTDSYAFYKKYLYEMRKEQALRGGRVPDVVPATGQEGCSAVWGDAVTIIPWTLYEYYGDREILAESYESMKAWVNYLTEYDQGEQRLWKDSLQYGDWLALDNPFGTSDSCLGGTEEAFIAYVYYMYSTSIVRKSAQLLGKTEDVNTFEHLERELRDYIETEYFTKSGRCAIPTQTAYALSLKHGLTCDAQGTLDRMLEMIAAAGTKLLTGFVGTPVLPNVLSDYGADRTVYNILHNETYPGWLYSVKLGATTIWERWNSMEADGSVRSTGMNSFNHYAYGSIGDWMYRHIGGISPDIQCPGFKHAILRPIPDDRCGWAKMTYASAAGTYKTEWKVLDAHHVYTKITIPFDCSATLLLPYAKDVAAEQELTAGTYEFTYETIDSLKPKLTVDTPLMEVWGNQEAAEALKTSFGMVNMAPISMLGLSTRQLATKIMGHEMDEGLAGFINSVLSPF